MKRLILVVTLLLNEVCGATVTSNVALWGYDACDMKTVTIGTGSLLEISIPMSEAFVVTEPDMEVVCPNCKNPMKNLGNIAGLIYCSNPPQWDEVWVCDNCRVKKTIRKTGVSEPNYDYLKNYKED